MSPQSPPWWSLPLPHSYRTFHSSESAPVGLSSTLALPFLSVTGEKLHLDSASKTSVWEIHTYTHTLLFVDLHRGTTGRLCVSGLSRSARLTPFGS